MFIYSYLVRMSIVPFKPKNKMNFLLSKILKIIGLSRKHHIITDIEK